MTAVPARLPGGELTLVLRHAPTEFRLTPEAKEAGRQLAAEVLDLMRQRGVQRRPDGSANAAPVDVRIVELDPERMRVELCFEPGHAGAALRALSEVVERVEACQTLEGAK